MAKSLAGEALGHAEIPHVGCQRSTQRQELGLEMRVRAAVVGQLLGSAERRVRPREVRGDAAGVAELGPGGRRGGTRAGSRDPLGDGDGQLGEVEVCAALWWR